MNGNTTQDRCPRCGGASASTQFAADGSVVGVCGSCGSTFQMAPAPGGAGPSPGPQVPVPTGRTSGRRTRSAIGALISISTVLPFLIALPFIFSPRVCAEIDGSHQAALDTLRTCPRAQQLLGNDINAAWVGTHCGESSESGGSGSSHWSFTVTGSQNQGTFEFTAFKSGGQWSVSTATLWVDDQIVQIPGGCGVAPTMPTAPVPGVTPGVTTPGAASPGVPTPGATPTQPTAPAPATPAAGGGECARMEACCAAAGSNQHIRGMCQSLPAVRMSPNAEQTCGQLRQAALRVMSATGGSTPPQCQ
jgi:hypothetical protein